MEASKPNIQENYLKVTDNISKCKSEQNLTKDIHFIAVTKKRLTAYIKELYDWGQRKFGENYVNELLEKSAELPKDIEWHLIGHLQTNKIKKLLETIPNIIIESVDNIKLASELNKHCLKEEIKELRVFIEINISNTPTKTGCDLGIVNSIAEEIMTNCPNLKLIGIMSLGNVNNVEEFEQMCQIKSQLCDKFKLNLNEFIASFGTSDDYENAIKHGSDEVRVGSQLFITK